MPAAEPCKSTPCLGAAPRPLTELALVAWGGPPGRKVPKAVNRAV